MASRELLFTRRFFELWLFAFVTFFSAFQLLPAIPFRIEDLGGSKALAGSFLAVYTLASAFAAPVMGTVADHLGRKRMLIAASIGFFFFSIFYGVVESIPLLLMVGVVHGALWAGLMASASAIMSEYIPVSRRTEGLAYWGLASTAAIGIAPMVGLLVFERGWLVLCGEMAGLSIVMLLWARRLRTTDRPLPGSMPILSDSWDWKVIRAALSMAAVAFGYGGVTSYVAMLAIERRIQPKSIFFTTFAIAIVLVRIFASRLGDRFGTKAILYPSYAAIPVSLALLAQATSRPQMVTSAVLFGIGLGGAWPAFANFVLTHTDETRRARTFGSIVWAFDGGIASGSLAVGVMWDRWSSTTAFLVAAAVACLAIPIFGAASKTFSGTGVAGTAEHA
jgi:MFS family permease